MTFGYAVEAINAGMKAGNPLMVNVGLFNSPHVGGLLGMPGLVDMLMERSVRNVFSTVLTESAKHRTNQVAVVATFLPQGAPPAGSSLWIGFFHTTEEAAAYVQYAKTLLGLS